MSGDERNFRTMSPGDRRTNLGQSGARRGASNLGDSDVDLDDDWYKQALPVAEYEADEEIGQPTADNLARIIDVSLTQPVEKMKLKLRDTKVLGIVQLLRHESQTKDVSLMLNYSYQERKDVPVFF
ncbi:hypothetical protein RRG08_029912 [Elysia crispata]|uniref:Uncharacterized protein n=1 Tax=Elysia crispata TaxID=231223 RepID=A0AAE0YYN4_9GAST|nr:hypothetical protein RRG08_029912 [Elysia crispata]